MELPQPLCETEGGKPTHDFLSLYSNVQQDLIPASQGGYNKTHDFLEPLDRVGKGNAEETSGQETIASKKPLPPALPPPPLPIIDQQVLLPGPYTISNYSYFNQTAPVTVAQASCNGIIPDENSICSSYAGNGFTLWETSVGKMGQTRKENVVQRSKARADARKKMEQWISSERPSRSPTNNQTNSFSSSSLTSGQKSQSFMEMLRSANGTTPDDELDDDEEYFMKKESTSSTQITDLRARADTNPARTDQKPHTPRSKHSATEQRRRSKINDRFQTLRELIPNSEQKRDKASFLLEVIQRIKYLREKLNNYEGSYQGWNHEPGKLINRGSKQRLGENCMNQLRDTDGGAAPSAILDPKFDETYFPVSQTLFASTKSCTEQPGIVNKSTMPFHVSPQPGLFSPIPSVNTFSGNSNPNVISQTTMQGQSCQDRWHGTDFVDCRDELKEQQSGVEGGTISISSVYSQGLLKSLTQALESSGVDLSEARISVQIQLGKRRRNETASSLPFAIKKNEVLPDNHLETLTPVPNREKLKTDIS